MKTLLVTISFLLTVATLQAQQPTKNLIPNDVKDHMQARVDNGINMGIVVAVIDGDDVAYHSVGKTSENGHEVDRHSVFEIGSISKTFTTTLLADAVLRGEMKLSDPIDLYLPDGMEAPTYEGKKNTLLDLATHTSSLPRLPDNLKPADLSNPYKDYTATDMYSFLSSYELTRPIGSRYEYSNYGMALLGHILATHNHKSYDELMIERIADACGMDHTKVELTESMKAQLAKGHSAGMEVSNWDLNMSAGAGGIRSTASDMVKYLKANMGIDMTTITKAMQMTHEIAYKSDAQGSERGLGWHLDVTPTETFVAHDGATGGYRAFVGFVKGKNKGVVVLTNSDAEIVDIASRLLGRSTELVMPKVSIAHMVEREINSKGINSANAFYKDALALNPEKYNHEEGELNNLGYKYLQLNKMDEALAVFQMNVDAHPNASNPYDSLGEAYLMKGDSLQAIANYTRALELNPASANAKTYLKRLGVDVSTIVKDVEIPMETLNNYVGNYELTPDFIIMVSQKDGQLFAQATGQPQFELFATSPNTFYLKVVEASIVFNTNEEGMVESLTLHQNNQSSTAQKTDVPLAKK